MDKNISFTLKVWRQKGPKAKGAFETYQLKDIPGDTSFLEMVANLSYSTMTAAKVSAACVLFTSTDTRTDLRQVLLPARCICVASKMETPSQLNLGVLPVSR